MKNLFKFILENWDVLSTIFGGLLFRFFEKGADRKRLKKRVLRKYNSELLTKGEQRILEELCKEIERG